MILESEINKTRQWPANQQAGLDHKPIMATWPELKLSPINLYSIGAYLGTRLMTERMNLKGRLEAAENKGKPLGILQPQMGAKQEALDQGAHYRYSYTVKLTEADKERGFVTINLDPFRIADIYGMTSFPLMTILKKCLCAGNRGHKDMAQDLKDIINAAQRKLQMLEEDGRV
jgi:hypothetical protein